MKKTNINTMSPAVPDLLRAAGDILPAMAKAGQATAAKLNLPVDASVNAQIISQNGFFAMSLTASLNAAPPATPASPSSLPPPSVIQEAAKTYGKAFKEGFDRGYARGHEDGYDKGYEDGAKDDDYNGRTMTITNARM